MAFWGTEVKPKKPLPLSIERRLVVKQAALMIEKPSSEPCVLSVSVSGSDQQYVVCRLHEGRLEHCTLELPFSPSDGAVLHLKGPHSVHLTGFLDVDEEDNLNEMDGPSGKALGADDDDDDDDDDDFDEMDEDDDDDDDDDEEDDDEEGEDDEDDEGDEDDEDEEDDDDDDEDEDEVVVTQPPAKKAKKEAAPAPVAAAKPAAAKPTKSSKPAKAAEPPPAASASPSGGANPWTKDEESKFKKAMAANPEGVERRWEKVAAVVGTRNKDQCKKKYQNDKKGK